MCMANKWDHISKKDIERERDERGLSWRQVATNLGLGSPATARKAYTALTGRPHNEKTQFASNVTRNTGEMGSSKGRTKKTYLVDWNDETDHEEIRSRCTGARLVVDLSFKDITHEEEVRVRTVGPIYFDDSGFGDLVLDIVDADTGATRTFKACDIKEVK